MGRVFDKPEDVPEGWTEQPGHAIQTLGDQSFSHVPLETPVKTKRKYVRKAHAQPAAS